MTEFLKFELIVQIILVVIIIIQTTYVGNTMKLNRSMNQYNLTFEWNQKLRDIYHKQTIPNISDSQTYEHEYQNLIYVFHDMHNLIKDKLLKSSDFFTMFMRLHALTEIESENNSTVFRKNHMILQIIYEDFNTVDCAMELFRHFDNDMVDSIKRKTNKNSLLGIIINDMAKDFKKYRGGLKIGLWFAYKIRKKPLFVLPLLKN